jgi:hypothetical protein
MVLVAVGGVAAAAGLAAGLDAVPGPGLLCITPFGTATAGSGCDPQHVSATLAVVAGVLSAVVTGRLALAVVAALVHRRAAARVSVDGE